MIAVIFAVPQESRGFRRALGEVARFGDRGWLQGRLGAEEIVVVHTGIGAAAAEREVHALLAETQPEWLLSAGFAGGLEARVTCGTVFVAENFSDPGLAARCPALPRWILTTQAEATATPEKKSALAAATGAQAVDMETAAIVRAAGGRPVLAVRAISDGVEDPLPVPLTVAYDLGAQRPRPLAVAGYMVRHPGAILPFWRFLGHLSAAEKALQQALLSVFAAS